MSRPVRWSTDALTDFTDQVAHVATHNYPAARRMTDVLDATAQALGDVPSGQPGRVTGTYEKSVTGLPYILAYAIVEDTVVIVRVIHTSRDWPAEGWPDQP